MLSSFLCKAEVVLVVIRSKSHSTQGTMQQSTFPSVPPDARTPVVKANHRCTFLVLASHVGHVSAACMDGARIPLRHRWGPSQAFPSLIFLFLPCRNQRPRWWKLNRFHYQPKSQSPTLIHLSFLPFPSIITTMPFQALSSWLRHVVMKGCSNENYNSSSNGQILCLYLWPTIFTFLYLRGVRKSVDSLCKGRGNNKFVLSCIS